VATCRIGPGSLLERHNIAQLYCPRCYLELDFPKVIERKVWKLWYDEFSPRLKGQVGFLRTVIDQINVGVASAGWYVSTEVRLTGILCPQCNSPMEPGCDTGNRLVCPKCGGRSTVLSEVDSFISGLQGVPEGFS
jgi:hypothetical protein